MRGSPAAIPEAERDYYLEERYPAFGNLVPRDVASRAAKEVCDRGNGVGATGQAVYLDLRDAIQRVGRAAIEQKYGNLFQMYEQITGEDAYQTPMRIYPAVHYTMGGLWVDYNLMSTVPGLFVLGEANFSDHGANRLGASALMQGLADGYFVLPATIGSYLAGSSPAAAGSDHAAFRAAEQDAEERMKKLLAVSGNQPVDHFHRELGRIMWDRCGMSRNAAGLREAAAKIPELRERFWREVNVPGAGGDLNQPLERAGRVADFLEFAEVVIQDALARNESCGSHFREEHQSDDNEALRNDADYAYVAAWEHRGVGEPAVLHREPLKFEEVHPTVRSYK